MTEAIEVGGQKMKPCPGWEGNSYRCGRGNPRLIREDAEVCENCSRGMRKRGQKTREEEAREASKRAQDEARRTKGIGALVERLGGLPSKSQAKFLEALIAAAESLTDKDLDRESYWHRERIGDAERWSLVRGLVGLPELTEGRRRW